MTLVLTKVAHTVIGNKRMHIYTGAFDNSYPTNGEAYTPGDLGLTQNPELLIVLPHNGFVFDWDKANKKIKARALSIAGGAAAAGTDALSIKAGVLNKEAAGVANVGLQEATSTSDMSGLTAVPIIAIGTV